MSKRRTTKAQMNEQSPLLNGQSSSTGSSSTTFKSPPSSSSRTIKLEELEDWRLDNEYILTGYRRTLPSYKQCIQSLSYWHNESVNIWTHLLGSLSAVLALLYLATQIFKQQPGQEGGRLGWRAPFSLASPFKSSTMPTVTWLDAAGFSCFFLAAISCLGFSASFHTFSAHSKEVCRAWNRMDYVGIVLLICGTMVPLLRYLFFCSSGWQHFYLVLITIAGSATIGVVLAPHAHTPEYRRFRTWVFISLGMSAVVPVAHAVMRYGWEAASDAVGLPYAALGGLLYIMGALLYAERCPERFSPGSFDLVGASHQLFHVFILFAATAHYCAIAESFRFWHGEMKGICHGPYA
ncbi:HlyIII-domain-containing protein [Meredithblackwellia eburnea MCA 4105]